MNSKNAKVTVIVASCDAYSDLWEPFSRLFKRYWPNCPYDVVLVTESSVSEPERYVSDRIVSCGKGVGWGDRLVMALQQLQTPYVILLCDDYFLCDQVDTSKIEKIVGWAEKYHSGYFLMVRTAETRPAFSETEGLFELKKGRGYCVGTQAGVWDVRFLEYLAFGCNSIWEFERLGSFKCVGWDQPILGTLKMVFPFEDVVHKGRWEVHGVRLCDRNDIDIDYSRRKQMTDLMMAKEYLKGAILKINPTLVLRIQNFLKLGHK